MFKAHKIFKHSPAKKAKEILDLVWDGNFPVDIKKITSSIVAHHNIEGVKKNFKIKLQGKSTEEMNGFSGRVSIIETDEPHYLIEYDSSEISFRHRFVIAHALGHIVLGHFDENNKVFIDSHYGIEKVKDKKEIEASYFAMELLIPNSYFQRYFQVAKNIQQLAECFEVSTAAILFKIKDTNAIQKVAFF